MVSNKHQPHITFLLSYSSIFHLGAWRNSIELWLQKGYKVTLIQFRDGHVKSTGSDLETKYNLVQIPYPLIVKVLLYTIKFFFRTSKKAGLSSMSTIGDGIAYLIKSSYYILSATFLLWRKKSDVYIAGDSPSLIAAYILSRKIGKKLVFWELELQIESELPDFGQRLLKRIEKICSKKIICAVEFGEKRSELLRKENEIPNNISIILIPNSLLGIPKRERAHYFNDKFNIPNEKKIVLFAGGIYSKNSGIDTLWKGFETWPQNMVLIIHSRENPHIAQRIALPEKIAKSGRVFLNIEPLPFHSLSIIYASCDIGIIPVRVPLMDNHSNIYYSEWSLGRLFQYTYYGVPVIISRLYGYNHLVEGNGIGMCFDDPNEIGALLRKILENEESFKQNSIAFSKNYNYEKYHKNLEMFMSTVL